VYTCRALSGIPDLYQLDITFEVDDSIVLNMPWGYILEPFSQLHVLFSVTFRRVPLHHAHNLKALIEGSLILVILAHSKYIAGPIQTAGLPPGECCIEFKRVGKDITHSIENRTVLADNYSVSGNDEINRNGRSVRSSQSAS
jgi:hypothetical protein